MISNRDLLVFMAEMTVAVIAVTAIGYYYFSRWSKREKEVGRQHIDAHVAEIMRERPTDEE